MGLYPKPRQRFVAGPRPPEGQAFDFGARTSAT